METDKLNDILERVGATFWQGAVAAAPVTFVPDLGWVEQTAATMAIAGLAALLAAAKGIVRARKA